MLVLIFDSSPLLQWALLYLLDVLNEVDSNGYFVVNRALVARILAQDPDDEVVWVSMRLKCNQGLRQTPVDLVLLLGFLLTFFLLFLELLVQLGLGVCFGLHSDFKVVNKLPMSEANKFVLREDAWVNLEVVRIAWKKLVVGDITQANGVNIFVLVQFLLLLLAERLPFVLMLFNSFEIKDVESYEVCRHCEYLGVTTVAGVIRERIHVTLLESFQTLHGFISRR